MSGPPVFVATLPPHEPVATGLVRVTQQARDAGYERQFVPWSWFDMSLGVGGVTYALTWHGDEEAEA